eukprot:gene35934-65934_t
MTRVEALFPAVANSVRRGTCAFIADGCPVLQGHTGTVVGTATHWAREGVRLHALVTVASAAARCDPAEGGLSAYFAHVPPSGWAAEEDVVPPRCARVADPDRAGRTAVLAATEPGGARFPETPYGPPTPVKAPPATPMPKPTDLRTSALLVVPPSPTPARRARGARVSRLAGPPR